MGDGTMGEPGKPGGGRVEWVVVEKRVCKGGRVERRGLGGAVELGGEGEKGEPGLAGGEVMERTGRDGWVDEEGVGSCCCC